MSIKIDSELICVTMSKRDAPSGSESESEILNNIRELQRKLSKFKRKLRRKRQRRDAEHVNQDEQPSTSEVERRQAPMINWRILERTEDMSERFQARMLTVRTQIDINMGASLNLLDIVDTLERTFGNLISTVVGDGSPEDMVRVSLRSPVLDSDIWLPFMKREHFHHSMLLAEILRVNQSKRDFLLQGDVEVTCFRVKLPYGGGNRGRNAIIDFSVWKKKAHSVITVKEDGLCCARSIVLGKAYADGLRGKQWRALREDFVGVQYKEAVALCETAGVNPTNLCGIEELKKFEQVLPGYQLIVCNASQRSSFLYYGKEAPKQILLLYGDNHYDCLLSITAFLRCNYFCFSCKKGYLSRGKHKCDRVCSACLSLGVCEPSSLQSCRKCHRTFYNEACRLKHQNICKLYSKCLKCGQLVKGKTHPCGKVKCYTCKKYVEQSTHICYVEPLCKSTTSAEDATPRVFLFYDFESILSSESNGSFRHYPNLCVAKVTCDNCWDTESRSVRSDMCSFCIGGTKNFYGLSAVEDFCTWLFDEYHRCLNTVQKSNNLKKIITVFAFAHNAKAYDLQFILKYLVENGRTPSVIRNGSRLLCMSFSRFRFLDSINFLPMPLSRLPKTFGLEGAIAKGCFPYAFNTFDNINYVGKWPALEYYDLRKLSQSETEDFMRWYEQQKEKVFNIKEELIAYCDMDVTILLRCVMYFRDLFREISGLDPFTRAITLPGACMEVFRTSFLKSTTITITPSCGYEPKRKASFIGTVWLDYIEKTNSICLRREERIGPYFADAYDPKTNTVYEFFGCIFHGCITCFPSNRTFQRNPINQQNMDELYQKVEAKRLFYQQHDYKLVEIWECEFKNLTREDAGLQEFLRRKMRNLRNSSVRPPLDARQSFYGGRVNAAKLFHECGQDERILYFDFCSLYPYVIKYCKFPVGPPKIIKEFTSVEISSFFGLIFCRILPPKDLKFPVLPIRQHGRLMFVLCDKCGLELNQADCEHNDEDRCLVGTWVTEEVKKAVELGYQVQEIYEVWHYEKFAQYSKNSEGLFEEFINHWLKIKIENSGWPPGVSTDEEKAAYIRSYAEREGINLAKEKIAKNPGLRSLGKLMANSFWGKFAQRNNVRKTIFVREPEEFFNLLTNPSLKVHDAYLVSTLVMLVAYGKKEDLPENLPHSNVALGAFTTAYARLKLYDLLHKLQDRVLYYDTDSVIFTTKLGESIPPTGAFLGDLTDEISEKYGAQAKITRFVAGGPKNYAMEIQLWDGSLHYEIKVKGLSLGMKTATVINFQTMKSLIDRNIEQIKVPQTRFVVNKYFDVFSQDFDKNYQFNFVKRRIVNNYFTLPYGFAHA